MYSRSKKERNSPNYFNINFRTEIKLVPIIMDYCLLQFDALEIFLEVRLHGESLPNYNFFKVNPLIFQGNHKAHLIKCLELNLHKILALV